MLEGPNEGATVGFVSGLAQDFLMNEPKGLTALTLTLLGYSVGMFRQFIVSPSPLVPTIVALCPWQDGCWPESADASAGKASAATAIAVPPIRMLRGDMWDAFLGVFGRFAGWT